MLEVMPVRPALRTLVFTALITIIGAAAARATPPSRSSTQMTMDGSLVVSVHRALSTGNDGHGINFDENRTGDGSSDTEGDLTASVSNSTSTGNTGAGVRADQQIPLGVGSLLLTDVTTLPNAGGATTGSNVTVTVAP